MQKIKNWQAVLQPILTPNVEYPTQNFTFAKPIFITKYFQIQDKV